MPDIRGYTRFTEQHGDEASANLAARFSEIVRDGVQVRGGELIEIRGDEALAVFDSARQAIRAAMDLQSQFAEETDMVSNCPIRVRSEEHTSELQSLRHLVCRLLLEKKKKIKKCQKIPKLTLQKYITKKRHIISHRSHKL